MKRNRTTFHTLKINDRLMDTSRIECDTLHFIRLLKTTQNRANVIPQRPKLNYFIYTVIKAQHLNLNDVRDNGKLMIILKHDLNP